MSQIINGIDAALAFLLDEIAAIEIKSTQIAAMIASWKSSDFRTNFAAHEVCAYRL